MNEDLNRIDPFDNNNLSKHGCAWFEEDNPTRTGKDATQLGGWACIAGSEPFYFNNVKELSIDVIWWTNLNKAENWRLGKLKRFKESTLFGIEWTSLISETSLKEKRSEIVKYWSEIFARSAEWLSRWQADIKGTNWDWGEGSLADALRIQMLPEDKQDILEVENILAKAYCEKIDCEVPSELLQGKNALTLSLPRLKHAENIFNTLTPISEWTLINKNDWPENQEDKITWIKKLKKPMLIQIAVTQIKKSPSEDENWQHISVGQMWLGKRGSLLNTKALETIWITENELINFSKFAEFEIISGYMSSGWEKVKPNESLLNNGEGPLIYWSTTKGLIALSSWQALSGTTRDPKNRRKGITTGRAVWLRAKDRLYTFSAALVLQSKGYTVLSYGNGQVTIAFDVKGSLAHLAESIRQAGLIVPMRLVEKIEQEEHEFKKEMNLNSEKVSEIDNWMKGKWIQEYKNKERIKPLFIDIDRLILPWWDKTQNSILKNSAQRLIALDKTSKNNDKWWSELLIEQAQCTSQRLKNLVKEKNSNN